jgi:hypothetical protein
MQKDGWVIYQFRLHGNTDPFFGTFWVLGEGGGGG